jgi:outer membrane protein assembly factor BamB
MPVSVNGRFVRTVAAVAVLSLTTSGCWLQRGFDAGRSRFVGGTAPITTDNADELVELWRATGLGGGVSEPVVLGGDVFVTAQTARVARISASTGAVAYTRALPSPPAVLSFTLRGLVHHDGELAVGWESVLPVQGGFGNTGGLARVEPATGDLIEPLTEDPLHRSTIDIAVEGGALVQQKQSATLDTVFTGFTEVDWRGIRATTGQQVGFVTPNFAVAGDHLAWGLFGSALGWNGSTCSHPDPGGQVPGQPPSCLADWQTPLGTTLSGTAALGTDAAVYGVDTNRIAVLDAATGAVRFTGTIPGSPASAMTGPAVAGNTILVGTSDGRIAAFSATGCGQADCAPLWQATIGTTMTGAPTVVGDVVYATTSNQLVALRLAGCGGDATCPPIATYDVGAPVTSVAYDNGRIFVATTDGQVVAFGLPPAT